MATMQVILTEDIKKLGRKHEAVVVRPGYALNFLIPQGKAMPATPGRLEKAEKLLEEILIQKERIQEKAAEVKDLVEKLGKVSFEAKVSDNDTLYGSISEKEIIEEVEEQINVRLESKHVRMPEHIKKTGEYKCLIVLGEGVEAELMVEVKAAK